MVSLGIRSHMIRKIMMSKQGMRAYMFLGIAVICVVLYCYVNFVVIATEVELCLYLYGKDFFLPR